jgi:hypothetical protein
MRTATTTCRLPTRRRRDFWGQKPTSFANAELWSKLIHVMADTIVISEWDADLFHQRVLEFERKGYVARRESYRITAEMNPETGIVSHVHSIELYREKANTTDSRTT